MYWIILTKVFYKQSEYKIPGFFLWNIYTLSNFLKIFISLLIWYNSKKCNKKGNKTFIALFFILNWQTKHSTSRFTLMINIFILRCTGPET